MTHELGHTFGLKHDGYLDPAGEYIEYRGEHGEGETRWSPIMGHGNGLSQWSKGDYPDATNDEADISILVQALGRRPDDFVGISPLTTDIAGSVDVEGIIGTSVDSDLFSLELIRESHVSLDVLPWHNGPNLDIAISLSDSSGNLLVRPDDVNANPSESLAAFLDESLSPGTYFLMVDGVGKASLPNDPGYNDYGSLGYYRIVGSIGEHLPGDIDADGELSANDIDALFMALALPADQHRGRWDLDGDSAVSNVDVDVLVHEVLKTEYGDFNLDGSVDFSDFLVLCANFGKHDRNWSSGDANGDRSTSFEDFLLLAANFAV